MELYYHDTDADILILSADGGIDASNAEAMLDELGKLVDAGARRLIVDCTRIGFISSYGIAVLVRTHKKLAERGGDVKLAALESRITRLIDLVGLASAFEIYPNVDAARAAFR